MAPERSPAFQFYPSDFLSDEHVVLMCHTERGVYITLLCMCWLHGSLPADLTELATLVSMPAQRFQKLWMNQLTKCFQLNSGDGRLHQKRLDKEREKQQQFARRQSDNGRLGGRPRLIVEPSPEQGLGFSGLTQTKATPKPTSESGLTQTEPKKSSSSSSSSSSSDFCQRDPSDLSQARAPNSQALTVVSDPGFDAFWKVYPRKTGKDAARKEWKKRHFSAELQLQILAALAWQKQQDTWQQDRGRFVPHPATWLHNGRWEDEPSEIPATSALGKSNTRLAVALANIKAEAG